MDTTAWSMLGFCILAKRPPLCSLIAQWSGYYLGGWSDAGVLSDIQTEAFKICFKSKGSASSHAWIENITAHAHSATRQCDRAQADS